MSALNAERIQQCLPFRRERVQVWAHAFDPPVPDLKGSAMTSPVARVEHSDDALSCPVVRIVLQSVNLDRWVCCMIR
ncbi:hypothetical protein [Kineococcus xinjiangensis]|uniref:hypothetical protein n=1 Tax=Kineococcus xinjiangensis TaxID=512762 RepID=UPI00147456E5|nr:hypothetical protein [Kineococcus xinjiangensis]